MTFSCSFHLQKPSILERVKDRLRPKSFRIDSRKVHDHLPPHLHDAASELPGSLRKISRALAKKESITLYYPGCGQDLVWPILTLDGICPDAKSWTIIGQDTAPCFGALVSTFQTITGQAVFHHAASTDETITGARFTFKDKAVIILFKQGDALEENPHFLEKGYDIHLERGFEIMRAQKPGSIHAPIRHLRPKGIALTDHPFQRELPTLKRIPTQLPYWGFYKSPTVYLKKK